MLLTFFIALFILLMQFLWLRLDQIVGKGLDALVILEFIFWSTLTLIPMALPLSTLLASIMTMGDMGESNELLALKSAGVSLQRVMMPLMILIFCISAFAFYVSNNILPLSNLKMRTLLYDIRNKRPDVMIETGVFYNGITGYSLKIQNKDSKTNLLRKVLIYDHSKIQGNISVTIADSGYINATPDGKNLIVTLYNGNTYEDERGAGRLSEGTHPFSHRQFSKQDFIVRLEGYDLERTNEDLFKSSSAMMLNLKDLNKSIDSFSIIQNRKSHEAFINLIYSNSFHNGLELDSLSRSKGRFVHKVNVDSLFATLSAVQKSTVVSVALTKAESIKKEYGDDYIGIKTMLEVNRKQLAQFKVERHMKFTLSAACIIFFFIGAPLGAIIRKGGLGMPVVVSLFLFIGYWVMFSTGIKLANQGSWNPTAAMWFPSIILLPLGIFLTYKSTTDSALFNAERYVDFFKKVFNIFPKLHSIGQVNFDTIDNCTPRKEPFTKKELAAAADQLTGLGTETLSSYAAKGWAARLFGAIAAEVKGYDIRMDELKASYDNFLCIVRTFREEEALVLTIAEYPTISYKHRYKKIYIALRLVLLTVFSVLFCIYAIVKQRYMYINYKKEISIIVSLNKRLKDQLENKEDD